MCRENLWINQKLKNNPSFSYGIAEFPSDSKSKAKLIELADQKMYLQKKAGYNAKSQG